MKTIRKWRIKWLVWRGKAVDIWSKSDYPADVLSNLCSNGFRFDGLVCGSMEGFLQSLKQKDPDRQRQLCSMKGRKARCHSVDGWQTDQTVWWRGKPIDRQSEAFRQLISRAYQAMFQQNTRFKTALMSTRGKRLFHTRGEYNPYRTILTPTEFCEILTALRESYDRREQPAAAVILPGDGPSPVAGLSGETAEETLTTLRLRIADEELAVRVKPGSEDRWRAAALRLGEAYTERRAACPGASAKELFAALALERAHRESEATGEEREE